MSSAAHEHTTQQISVLLGTPIASLERITDGKNSKVYKVTSITASRYIAKKYFYHAGDPRDRLAAEFGAFEFLWGRGVRCIPRPVSADRKLGIALYEFIDGKKIRPSTVADADIDVAASFLIRLKDMKDGHANRMLPAASEAYFSIRDVVSNIQRRLRRLNGLNFSGTEYLALHSYLDRDFVLIFEKVVTFCKEKLAKNKMLYDGKINKSQQTLSPSDFGFHNALRRRDGSIAFVDFEYFGWDDPAKMIADFLLHPAMQLKKNFRKQFTCAMLRGFKENSMLPERLKIMYPLCGLKWCMIFLNEFVPEHLQRRNFAGGGGDTLLARRAEQLEKARTMLDRVKKEYRQFPYYA